MIALPLDIAARFIRGATEIERLGSGLAPLRLPAWTRAQHADRWIELWSAQTVGVRLVARTCARRIAIEMTVTRMVPADATAPPFPCLAVATIGGAEVGRAEIVAGPTIHTRPDGTWSEADGPRSVVEFALPESDVEREVSIWLPHNGATVIHGVSADAPLEEAAASARPRWVHHGSSISHCPRRKLRSARGRSRSLARSTFNSPTSPSRVMLNLTRSSRAPSWRSQRTS